MDGDKVSEIKYLYEYTSEEEALSMLEEITEKYKEIDYIKEIKVNGTNIEVFLKEEVYKDLDLETIISKYF